MPANDNGDTHAHVRFFKLLEVAYNAAQNGYYERAFDAAEVAVLHYQETNVGDRADEADT